MKAGAAAAGRERDRGWRVAGRREWHGLSGRRDREARERKERGNQGSSHEFAFRLLDTASF